MRRALLALPLVLFFLGAPAQAAGAKGPGPFSNVEIRDGRLVFDVKSNGAIRFTGSPRVFAAVRSAWIPVDGAATTENDGSRLVQSGTIAGVPIDAFFADGEIRRVLVRNGAAGETEIDLYRIQNGFLQAKVNRAPSSPVPAQPTGELRNVIPESNRSVAITLDRPASSGLDVVLAIDVPPLDEGINSQGVGVIARDVESGATTYSQGAFATDGTTLYRHITLGAGTYRLSLVHTLEFGNPLVASGSRTFTHDVDGLVSVSSSSRLFDLVVPHDVLPALLPTTLTLAGLEPFEPSVGSPLAVTLTVVSSDSTFTSVINRDSLVATPLAVTLPLPEGEFGAAVLVAKPPLTPNSVGHYEQFALAPFVRADEVALVLPELVRVTGTILDPTFALVSNDEVGPGGPPIHFVAAHGSGPDGRAFSGAGLVRGFARGFSFHVPRGAMATLDASLDVAIGEPLSGNDFSKNDSGLLELTDVASGPVTFDDDKDVDVSVAAVPRPSTVAGVVTDKKGRPVKFAFVIATSTGIAGDASATLATYVSTDKDGRFTLRLPRGVRYTLTVYGPYTGN